MIRPALLLWNFGCLHSSAKDGGDPRSPPQPIACLKKCIACKSTQGWAREHIAPFLPCDLPLLSPLGNDYPGVNGPSLCFLPPLFGSDSGQVCMETTSPHFARLPQLLGNDWPEPHWFPFLFSVRGGVRHLCQCACLALIDVGVLPV